MSRGAGLDGKLLLTAKGGRCGGKTCEFSLFPEILGVMWVGGEGGGKLGGCKLGGRFGELFGTSVLSEGCTALRFDRDFDLKLAIVEASKLFGRSGTESSELTGVFGGTFGGAAGLTGAWGRS